MDQSDAGSVSMFSLRFERPIRAGHAGVSLVSHLLVGLFHELGDVEEALEQGAQAGVHRPQGAPRPEPARRKNDLN
eukprot:874855-Prorocentrum_minimum.AAC.7